MDVTPLAAGSACTLAGLHARAHAHTHAHTHTRTALSRTHARTHHLHTHAHTHGTFVKDGEVDPVIGYDGGRLVMCRR
jgi:hypothetical protein